MKCSKTRRLLPRYVDSELSDSMAEQVREHLAGCESCRAEETDLRRTLSLLNEWSDITPKHGFEEALRRSEQPAIRQAWLPVPGWAAAGLAMVSLAGGTVAGISTQSARATKPPSQMVVAEAMDLHLFSVNDVLEASIEEGLSTGQDAQRKVVE